MRLTCAFSIAMCLVAAAAVAQQVKKDTIAGVNNYARLESTIACAGATKPEAVPEIKKLGFASIINLRMPDEKDADIPAEAAAAKEAGITFIHIPFSGSSPDPAAVDKFIDAVTTPANEPAYIHCHSGNRAAAMWMAKRIAVDHWDVARATAEAESLGLTNNALKEFATTYGVTHKR